MTREEAIPILRQIAGSYGDIQKYYDAMWMAIEALKEQQWIPVSERLPEVDKEVFVYIYNMPFIAWVDKNGEWNTETFTLDKELEKDDEPIAWMSLPKEKEEKLVF